MIIFDEWCMALSFSLGAIAGATLYAYTLYYFESRKRKQTKD